MDEQKQGLNWRLPKPNTASHVYNFILIYLYLMGLITYVSIWWSKLPTKDWGVIVNEMINSVPFGVFILISYCCLLGFKKSLKTGLMTVSLSLISMVSLVALLKQSAIAILLVIGAGAFTNYLIGMYSPVILLLLSSKEMPKRWRWIILIIALVLIGNTL